MKPLFPIGLLALTFLLAVLFFVAAAGEPVIATPLPKQATAAENGSQLLDLRIESGSLHGSFEDRPIAEVLEAFHHQAGLEFEVDEDLLGRLVSGNFEGAPLIEAMRDILEPFNYVMALDAKGEIKSLHITGLRHEPKGAGEQAAPLFPREADRDTDFISTAPGVALTEEDYRLFEGGAHPSSDIPPELREAFEPWQEPWTEETGPTVPEGYVAEDLPPFEPVESETGPVDLSVVVQDLPEFVPVVSETGPPVSPVGPDGLLRPTFR